MAQADLTDSNEAMMAAATLLCQARLHRERFDHLPAALVPADESAAYRVQDLLHLALSRQGWGALVGYKIGCTTPVMQEYLGIHNPCAGGIFAPTVQRLQGEVDTLGTIQLGVECEIAVQLASPLLATDAPFGRSSIAAAVAGYMAAIELVEDRYIDYPDLDTPTLIADDFFGAGCVLGPLVTNLAPADLPAISARMIINGQSVGSGTGADILGHPLEALTWLANSRAERGLGLQAGEVVLLGSLVQTKWVYAGDTVVIENEQLGTVRCEFH